MADVKTAMALQANNIKALREGLTPEQLELLKALEAEKKLEALSADDLEKAADGSSLDKFKKSLNEDKAKQFTAVAEANKGLDDAKKAAPTEDPAAKKKAEEEAAKKRPSFMDSPGFQKLFGGLDPAAQRDMAGKIGNVMIGVNVLAEIADMFMPGMGARIKGMANTFLSKFGVDLDGNSVKQTGNLTTKEAYDKINAMPVDTIQNLLTSMANGQTAAEFSNQILGMLKGYGVDDPAISKKFKEGVDKLTASNGGKVTPEMMHDLAVRVKEIAAAGPPAGASPDPVTHVKEIMQGAKERLQGVESPSALTTTPPPELNEDEVEGDDPDADVDAEEPNRTASISRWEHTGSTSQYGGFSATGTTFGSSVDVPYDPSQKAANQLSLTASVWNPVMQANADAMKVDPKAVYESAPDANEPTSPGMVAKTSFAYNA